MNIERQIIQGNGFTIPSIMLTPAHSRGAAVIVHGYGGCKEELLGFAWRVAESGITACVIDLRGHGEHELPLDGNMILDVETAIQYCRQFGKVTAIGHSVGGRLALLSSADYIIGLSPALSKNFGNQTQKTINSVRGYRVREIRPNILFETLNALPEWRSAGGDAIGIIIGERDVPEIISKSNELKAKGVSVTQIDKALHSDIFLLEETFQKVNNQLNEWF